jgi:hypothetical protein
VGAAVNPALRFALGLGLAALLHALGVRLIPSFSGGCDLFLVVTLIVARRGRPEAALIGGSLAGWAADAFAGSPFGLFGFTDAAVGYATALAARRLVVERPASLVGLFAAAGAAQGALLVVVSWLILGVEVPGPGALALRVICAALLGPLAIRIAGAVLGRWRRFRRRPSGGIRLPKSLLS